MSKERKGEDGANRKNAEKCADRLVFGAFFDHEQDSDPLGFDTTWGDFVTLLGADAVHVRNYKSLDKARKEGLSGAALREFTAPGFSLARFVSKDGKIARRNIYVDALSGIVLDYDEDYSIDAVLAALEGVAYAAYTTYSHDPSSGKEKWRVVVPLSVPVPGPKYKAARSWLLNRLGGNNKADPQASALSNFYFLPACPPGREGEYELRTAIDAPFLELPALSDFSRGLPPPRIVGTKLDWIWLKARMRAYKRPDVRDAFKRVLRGEPWSDKGNRDSLLLLMTGALAGWAPHAEPAELASFFADSIAAMQERDPDDPPPDLDNAESKIARSQSSLLASAREENPARAESAQSIDLPAPASEDQAETWAREAGLEDIDALRRALIINNDKDYYIFSPHAGTWEGPYVEAGALACAKTDLPGFPGVDVTVRKVDGGLRMKTMQEMMYDYGIVHHADKHVVLDLTKSVSTWNPESRTLIRGGDLRVPLEPLRDPVVEKWLNAFGGEDVDALLDWLAGVRDLSRAQHVLFINGPANVGKNYLVLGLLPLWGSTEAVKARLLFTNEHGAMALKSCPLVHLDEGKWTRNVDITRLLRELATEKSRLINPKHKSFIALRGYARVIITANNFDVLSNTDQILTPNDRAGISRRFLEIAPTAEAAEILDAIEEDELLKDDRIARHVLWLEETRKVEKGYRLKIKANAKLDRKLATESGDAASAVTQWIALWLSDPAQVEREWPGHVDRGANGIWVSPVAVLRTIEKVVGKQRWAPSGLTISRALQGISTGKRKKLPGGEAYEIRLEDVVAFIGDHALGDAERIQKNASTPKGAASAGRVLDIKKQQGKG
jgi:hypothetical protein